MAASRQPEETEPTREAVEQLAGPVLLEFGASWCGHCTGLAPHVVSLLDEFSAVRHLKIEDGKGRPLGRSFRVKLWPTFVLLRDGQVIDQLVRPEPTALRGALERLVG